MTEKEGGRANRVPAVQSSGCLQGMR